MTQATALIYTLQRAIRSTIGTADGLICYTAMAGDIQTGHGTWITVLGMVSTTIGPILHQYGIIIRLGTTIIPYGGTAGMVLGILRI